MNRKRAADRSKTLRSVYLVYDCLRVCEPVLYGIMAFDSIAIDFETHR